MNKDNKNEKLDKTDEKLHISDVRNSFLKRIEFLENEKKSFQKIYMDYESRFMGKHRFKDEIRWYKTFETYAHNEIVKIKWYLENYF